MEEKGTQDGPKPSQDSGLHRLYFKGLTREETRGLVAGFGVAICGQEDNILFQMKGSIHDSEITALEAELMALKRGLTEAVSLGITHISIYCDHYHIFELVTGSSGPEKDSIALLMNDVQRTRQQLTSSTPLLVTGDQTNKVAYKLASETLVSEISISMPPCHKKNTFCGICFDDDLEAEQMFSVALCGHKFCLECLKLHIQVELMERVPRCPRYGCKSKLTIESCAHLLTPKLRAMWEQRIEETTVTDWAMCAKCQQMAGVAHGFCEINCSCGYSFCYICGAEWKLLGAGCIHRNKEMCTIISCLVICFGILFCFLFIMGLFK
ncbi:Ribonuclease H domain [Arabidopsis suecica]|uniref:Ribonuclease H domain n=1 Tax=Arabidopsis suecica TaxID=45249 RepID=A0A8T1Z5J1_ARASU|nr:Ribonuclease H domain [Arabidopsis suecica]KAG7554196.1 Ribonuclease H domain [Arabidopsis suecica]